MNKISILLNPSAGSGRAIKQLPKLEAALKSHGIEYNPIYRPLDEEHFKRMAAGRSRYEELIIGAGGDGTFNAIANELVRNNRDTTLGMINLGTRGDITREFGTDSIDRACEAISAFQHGHRNAIKQADIGIVETDELGKFYFLGAVSLGLEDYIDRQISEFLKSHPKARKLVGLRPFEIMLGMYFANKSLRDGKIPIHVKVTYDEGSLETKAVAVIINNARYFDNGIMPSPGATPYDGKIDCCLVSNTPFTALVTDYWLMRQGSHINRPEVHLMQSKKFTFIAPNGIGVQVDGEIVGESKSISVSTIDRKLKVLAHPQYSRG